MEEDTCPLLRSSISVEFTPVTTAEDIAIQVFFFLGTGGGAVKSSGLFHGLRMVVVLVEMHMLQMMVVWMTVLLGK